MKMSQVTEKIKNVRAEQIWIDYILSGRLVQINLEQWLFGSTVPLTNDNLNFGTMRKLASEKLYRYSCIWTHTN